MTMTDPIADLLTRIRNGNQAYHDEISAPYSKLKEGVVTLLKQEGYITDFSVREPAEGEVGKTLTVTLAIISTSQGLLTDRQANKKGVGGEVLAYVW